MPATKHCRICQEELNGNIIKIKQGRGGKNVNSCACLCSLEWAGSVKKGIRFIRNAGRTLFKKMIELTPGIKTMARLNLRSESTAIRLLYMLFVLLHTSLLSGNRHRRKVSYQAKL